MKQTRGELDEKKKITIDIGIESVLHSR
jgi:hypothetical protein